MIVSILGCATVAVGGGQARRRGDAASGRGLAVPGETRQCVLQEAADELSVISLFLTEHLVQHVGGHGLVDHVKIRVTTGRRRSQPPQ